MEPALAAFAIVLAAGRMVNALIQTTLVSTIALGTAIAVSVFVFVRHASFDKQNKKTNQNKKQNNLLSQANLTGLARHATFQLVALIAVLVMGNVLAAIAFAMLVLSAGIVLCHLAQTPVLTRELVFTAFVDASRLGLGRIVQLGNVGRIAVVTVLALLARVSASTIGLAMAVR